MGGIRGDGAHGSGRRAAAVVPAPFSRPARLRGGVSRSSHGRGGPHRHRRRPGVARRARCPGGSPPCRHDELRGSDPAGAGRRRLDRGCAASTGGLGARAGVAGAERRRAGRGRRRSGEAQPARADRAGPLVRPRGGRPGRGRHTGVRRRRHTVRREPNGVARRTARRRSVVVVGGADCARSSWARLVLGS